jgi:hypothetical protein
MRGAFVDQCEMLANSKTPLIVSFADLETAHARIGNEVRRISIL